MLYIVLNDISSIVEKGSKRDRKVGLPQPHHMDYLKSLPIHATLPRNKSSLRGNQKKKTAWFPFTTKKSTKS